MFKLKSNVWFRICNQPRGCVVVATTIKSCSTSFVLHYDGLGNSWLIWLVREVVSIRNYLCTIIECNTEVADFEHSWATPAFELGKVVVLLRGSLVLIQKTKKTKNKKGTVPPSVFLLVEWCTAKKFRVQLAVYLSRKRKRAYSKQKNNSSCAQVKYSTFKWM